MGTPARKESKMKNFETISEVQILTAAYSTILNRLLHEDAYIKANPDKEIPFAHYWKNIYQAQVDELHEEIARLEKERRDQAYHLPDFHSVLLQQ